MQLLVLDGDGIGPEITAATCAVLEAAAERFGLPVTLSKTPGEINALGPQLGQDTELLMMDLLGYEWEQIEQFKAVGAIP